MRTLSSTLLAAQRNPLTTPYIEARVYDYEAGIQRLSWTRLYTGSEPDNHHGIAFDGAGDMHRIRAGPNNTLHYQKITNPGPNSNYNQWTQLLSDCHGPCAIAASGTRIYIFYRRTDNTLRTLYSHDYGQSWTNASLPTYSDVSHMAASWWGTGDNVVCLALRATIPVTVVRIVLNTANQTIVNHAQWSDGNHPIITPYGIGATFDPFEPAISIVIAGKESDSPYNHFDLFRTELSLTYSFLALESFLMSPEGEGTTYEFPDCHRPANPQSHETTRIVALENYSGTTAYTRPITCHMVKGTYWSDTTFTEPKPFLNTSPTYGLRIASTADYWWLSQPSGVWRAPRAATAPLILTTLAPQGRILAITQRSHTTTQPQPALTLTLDNSSRRFASPGQGELASLPLRNRP